MSRGSFCPLSFEVEDEQAVNSCVVPLSYSINPQEIGPDQTTWRRSQKASSFGGLTPSATPDP